MNRRGFWRGVGGSRSGEVPHSPARPQSGKGALFLDVPPPHFPCTAIISGMCSQFMTPPMFAISAHMAVSAASRGHATLPDGNAKAGECVYLSRLRSSQRAGEPVRVAPSVFKTHTHFIKH